MSGLGDHKVFAEICYYTRPCELRKLRKAGEQRKRLRRLAKPPTTSWAQDRGRIHGAGPQILKAGKSARRANHSCSLAISLTAAPASVGSRARRESCHSHRAIGRGRPGFSLT